MQEFAQQIPENVYPAGWYRRVGLANFGVTLLACVRVRDPHGNVDVVRSDVAGRTDAARHG